MRLSLGQYALHAACGLGLLLMPAVQEKLCAWPAAPPAVEPARRAEDGAPPARKSAPPPALATFVPDTVPARWPGHAALATAQRARPLPAGAWVDDRPGVQKRSQVGLTTEGLLSAGWPRRPAAQLLPTFGSAGIRLVRARPCHFHSSIIETGPPGA